MQPSDTAAKLMDQAQLLIQERGYNAFSYKDLAQEIGIRTASIHYHFPSKSDLGQAVMERYLEGLESSLAELERGSRTAKGRLKAFIKLYANTEARGAICLCGSLGSDSETLSEDLRDVVARYLTRSEAWLTQTIRDGQKAGEFATGPRPAEAAAFLLSALQGALILSRARQGSPLLATVQRAFLQTLGAG